MEKRKYTHWTPEKLMEVAKQYKTPGEFQSKNSGAYMASKRKGLFKAVTAHMTTRFWTKDMIQKEAYRFKTRSDFSREAKAAYSAASRMGILDEVCEHMPKYAGKGKKRGPNKVTKEKAKAEPTAKSMAEMMGLNK
jgi:hypothetical protein